MIRTEELLVDKKEQLLSVYSQDCEFYRYHDGLKWKRLQTAALIESGMIFVILERHTGLEAILVWVFGMLMLSVVFLFFLRNEKIADNYLKRIKAFEVGHEFCPET